MVAMVVLKEKGSCLLFSQHYVEFLDGDEVHQSHVCPMLGKALCSHALRKAL